MSAATAAHGAMRPSSEVSGPAAAAVAALVDRQRAVLADRLPDMVGAIGMRPVELWFVWGALAELLGDDAGQVEREFAGYLRQRHGLAAGAADEMAVAVRQACTASNALVDGMALGGRQAARGGSDASCFVAAALFLRYCEAGR